MPPSRNRFRTRRQQPHRVAADADVAVRQQRVPPAALAGLRRRTRRGARPAAPASLVSRTATGEMSTPSAMTPALGQRGGQPAGAAADVERRAGAVLATARRRRRRGRAPSLGRQVDPLAVASSSQHRWPSRPGSKVAVIERPPPATARANRLSGTSAATRRASAMVSTSDSVGSVADPKPRRHATRTASACRCPTGTSARRAQALPRSGSRRPSAHQPPSAAGPSTASVPIAAQPNAARRSAAPVAPAGCPSRSAAPAGRDSVPPTSACALASRSAKPSPRCGNTVQPASARPDLAAVRRRRGRRSCATTGTVSGTASDGVQRVQQTRRPRVGGRSGGRSPVPAGSSRARRPAPSPPRRITASFIAAPPPCPGPPAWCRAPSRTPSTSCPAALGR